MFLENGDGNQYTEDMIRNARKPIILYNAKYQKLTNFVLEFTYYCKMGLNFKNTQSYSEFLEIRKEKGMEYEDNLFKIDVFYNVCDIIFEGKEVKIEKVPEVGISTDTLERIQQLEDIDEYDLQTGYKHLVTENFFPMKIENVKFE